jgi:glycosyltransferase involved in cell wall biosynthesis
LHNPNRNLPQETGNEPLVTLAMPVYNAGRYLRPAVISILQQTLPDWELIIIDDGSSDGAVEGIRDLHDERIKVLRDGLNKGLAARLNEAIDLARGRFFARMDQDDISYTERLARQLALLEQNPETDLCAVRSVAIDANDELVGIMPFALTHEAICAKPWLGFYLPHPTWLGRVEWFRRHRYASPAPYFCEDQELLLRSYSVSRFACTPDILFAYRVRIKINWTKSVRTRGTLLMFQLRCFLAARNYTSCALAVATTAVRIALDSLNALVQNFGSLGYSRYGVVAIEADERRRWRMISTHLTLTKEQIE